MSDGRWMVLGVRALCSRCLRARISRQRRYGYTLCDTRMGVGWAFNRWKLVAGEGGVRGGEARMVDSDGRASAASEEAV